MSSIHRSALVYYSPAEMYSLVNDVGSYDSFLPWCRSSQVLSETEDTMEASVEIAKGVLNKTFTTRNHLTPGKKIAMELVNGPFKTLHGSWQFDPLKTENTCKITLQLEFEFSNAVASLAVKPIFTQIANSLVDAFIQRAIEVYGESEAKTINVEVAYAEPDRQLIIPVNVDSGTTVGAAIVQSGMMIEFPELDVENSKVGIFGKATVMTTVLNEGDRVEIYRPLIADPKEVRRKRAAAGKKTKKGR